MPYRLVASSRARDTEIYQDEDGNLVEVYYCKSGATSATSIDWIPSYLTVRYEGVSQEELGHRQPSPMALKALREHGFLTEEETKA